MHVIVLMTRVLSQKYCRTNGRRTAVRMGGVLQYKWEVYCWVSPSSRLRSQEGPAIPMGGYCRTNWRCTTVLSPGPVGVGVSETLLIRVSHQVPAEMSCQNRATPRQNKVSHLSPEPPVALSSHSQQAGGQGAGVTAGWWRVSLHFWVPKTDRATRGVAATVTPVALLCATKNSSYGLSFPSPETSIKV